MARPRKINSGLPSYCQKDRKTGKLWMYRPDYLGEARVAIDAYMAKVLESAC